ncbi:MAG: amino acid permease [Clostridium sp.]|uniref:APC family permease n=1 Tax=Clostridium sp. TaxID=1506 RepID=UPI003042DC6D
MSDNNNLLKDEIKLKRELGLGAATAIVVGNIIGSGIFMAPSSFARVTNPKTAIIAWIITAIGSLLIALSFANLGSKIPKTGGPIIYTRAAFGDFAGFLIAWSFWIGSWVGNAAIITAFMSYFTYFFPIATNPLLAFLISSAVLWTLTAINIFGVKHAGKISIVSTVLKIGVLVVFIVIAALNFDPTYLNTVSSPEVSGLSTLPAAIAIALWSFIGLESATVAGGEIKNPEKNIKKSTIYGIIIVSVIYILMSVIAMGAMNQVDLANSQAPLSDIINAATGGTWGGTFIAIGALISTLGATSGWLLTTARGAMGAAEDGLFPEAMKHINPKYNTPVVALVVSGICTNLLLIMNYVGSLQGAFDFMILLATLAFLPAYSFCSAAEIVLLFKGGKDFNIFRFLKYSFFSLLAFGYSIYAIYGTGSECVMYGFILMLLGIPIYVYMMLQKNKYNKSIDNLRKAVGIDNK